MSAPGLLPPLDPVATIELPKYDSGSVPLGETLPPASYEDRPANCFSRLALVQIRTALRGGLAPTLRRITVEAGGVDPVDTYYSTVVAGKPSSPGIAQWSVPAGACPQAILDYKVSLFGVSVHWRCNGSVCVCVCQPLLLCCRMLSQPTPLGRSRSTLVTSCGGLLTRRPMASSGCCHKGLKCPTLRRDTMALWTASLAGCMAIRCVMLM